MKRQTRMLVPFIFLYSTIVVLPVLSRATGVTQDRSYLGRSEKQSIEIGKRMRQSGRVAGERSIFNTDRAHGYKIGATWMAPEVIRATVRLEQIHSKVSRRWGIR